MIFYIFSSLKKYAPNQACKFGLLFLPFLSSGQATKISRVNTSGIEAYFKVVLVLKTGAEVSTQEWQGLFQVPVYQMMIAGRAIDTSILKSDMKHVFALSSKTNSSTLTTRAFYHKLYKDNQEQLEKYILLLHTSNVVDSIKSILYPFLPKRLQSNELFPELFYINYGAPEATGYGGVVINDLFHSYRIDSYKLGLVAAHEAFHSIVSTAFQQSLKKNIDYNAADFNLLYFLQNVSEEGVADLIDKPLLLKKASPVYKEVKQLTENDEILSVQYIKKLDSLFSLAFSSVNALDGFESFSAFASTYGRNGGHIPGRFMGTVIHKNGLLQKHLAVVDNPVSFIVTYNEAVKRSGNKFPVFSDESIAYLQRLKAKYWQE